jgi:hypothetical protein
MKHMGCLTLLGLLAAVVGTGCFSVPATRNYQTNGKRIPESLVGTTADKKIILGKTKIADALLAVIDQTEGERYGQGFLLSPAFSSDSGRLAWFLVDVSLSGRELAIPYQLRTATDVSPLMFAAGPRFEWRQVVLTMDANEVVVGVDSISRAHKDPRFAPPPRYPTAGRLLDVLSDEARAHLRDKGFLPPDEELRLVRDTAEREQAKDLARRAATTKPASRPASRQSMG